MNTQAVVENITLPQVISESGTLGATAIILSLLVLLASPIVFATAKNKRTFIMWFMKQTIVSNLIISLLIFTYGAFKAWVMSFHTARSSEVLLALVIEPLGGCSALIFIALALLWLRAALMTKDKLKER